MHFCIAACKQIFMQRTLCRRFLFCCRYVPHFHPILHHLIEDMNLPTEPFFSASNCDDSLTKAFYLRDTYYRNIEEVKNSLSISDEDFEEADIIQAVDIPENGDVFWSKIKGTSQLARNVTLGKFWSELKNSFVKDFTSMDNIDFISLAAYASYYLAFNGEEIEESMRSIEGGMDILIDELLRKLEKLSVTLVLNYAVKRIIENGKAGYTLMSNSGYNVKQTSCSKVILACGLRGVENITWVSEADRTHQIHDCTDYIHGLKAVKVFLTYKTAWWEKYGLLCGTVTTDLPIGTIMLLGNRSKLNGYATLIVYNYNHGEMIESLNNSAEERFNNVEGDLNSEYIPSKAVVDTIHFHLQKVFSEYCCIVWYTNK